MPIAAATSLVNLNLGNEVFKALDEMFPPLGNSQEFAMTHFPQFLEDAASAEGDCSYCADNGMITHGKDFSADESDDNYGKKPAAKNIGGVFSPKTKALLILQRFLSQ
jgi:hypothetical protein